MQAGASVAIVTNAGGAGVWPPTPALRASWFAAGASAVRGYTRFAGGLFGLGGTATELLADHAARLAPLTDQDVHDLITARRCAPLLFGFRGGGPVVFEVLEQPLRRLSRMASDLPQPAEADLNPVVARLTASRPRTTGSGSFRAALRTHICADCAEQEGLL